MKNLLIQSAMQHIVWDPPKLGSEEALKKQSAREEEALKQQSSSGWKQTQPPHEQKQCEGDERSEEPSEEVIAEVPATRRTPGRILEAPQPKKDKPSAEAALLAELDNMKMPTTFSQLTAISPTYVEELIKKLQNRIPGPQASKLSYIKEVGAKTHKVAGAMIKQEDEEEKDFNCFYSCALGYIETRIKDERVPFMIDSGSMVNVIPAKLAIDLGLEVVEYTSLWHRKLKNAFWDDHSYSITTVLWTTQAMANICNFKATLDDESQFQLPE
ncbi:hypothetical protein PCASD_10065 [Puccinia coronata f. sp. avenae]|uniref:Aspartic peptidase DDI1-type domain-containing protein n=1 Tax=Puccinia coronata f. sp. avenae TaxID=200324 RepID=A0A2N5UK33_9BASI|nr:hypothetical protein PCASD_10065 [Puccinia coronata f. sp. avenae]